MGSGGFLSSPAAVNTQFASELIFLLQLITFSIIFIKMFENNFQFGIIIFILSFKDLVHMRIKVSTLLFICMILTAYACAQSKPESVGKLGPKIKFIEEEYDFGNLDEGLLAKHEFKFTNLGEDTLRIQRIDPGWGCTAALLSSEVIAPGDSGRVEVVFNTKNRRGQNKKIIWVYSNDPVNQVVRLFLVANIQMKAKPPK